MNFQGQMKTGWDKLRPLAVAFGFGFAAMIILAAGINIPLPGTQVVTDPREILVTIGSALTGPVGGLLIGFMAGIFEPVAEIRWVSVLIHAAGGLWMALAYKNLVYDKRGLKLLLKWVLSVLVYYYVVLIPLSVIILALSPALYVQTMGADVSGIEAYTLIAKGSLTEAVVTVFFTSLVMFALSHTYRRPLW
jgi:uncharacterized membrane protein